MTISLYEAAVPTFLQTLDAVVTVLDKGAAYCRETRLAPAELVEARLHPQMRPLRFQVQRLTLHSRGAMEAILSGRLPPPPPPEPDDYAGLQARVEAAREALHRLTAEDVDARAGAEVVLEIGERRHFAATAFLLSFTLPNFYFHATTAYDILRMRGVPLGKRDFMGTLRLTTGGG